MVGRVGLQGQTRWAGTLPLPRAPRVTYCRGPGFLTWTVRRRTIRPPWKGCHKKSSYKIAQPVGRTQAHSPHAAPHWAPSVFHTEWPPPPAGLQAFIHASSVPDPALDPEV